MREIKFRAWDECQMRYSDSWKDETCSSLLSLSQFFQCLGRDAIIMQYTGLKDKNGKEIYEGDIVSAWSEGYNHKGEIKWRLSGLPCIIIYPAFANQGFWGLHGSERKNGDMIIDVTGKLEFVKGVETTVIDDGIEVIGNIYENPELLNP